MKKSILLLLAIASFAGVNAQINKGRSMLGIDLNYSHYKQEENPLGTVDASYKGVNFSSNLKYGVFISDHVMLGILAIANTTKSQNISDQNSLNNKQTSTSSSNSFGGGLFARYYQMLGKSRFAFFGQLAATYAAGKNIQTYENNGFPSNTTKSTGNVNLFGVWVNPGLTYFITKTLAVEGSLGYIGYSGQKTNYDGSGGRTGNTTNSNFNFNLLQNFSLGLNFYFGKTTEPVVDKTAP